MFFGGSPFEHFAGMHGGDGGGGRRPPADVDTTELYQILGVEKDSSESTIKKAYRKLALKVTAASEPWVVHHHLWVLLMSTRYHFEFCCPRS